MAFAVKGIVSKDAAKSSSRLRYCSSYDRRWELVASDTTSVRICHPTQSIQPAADTESISYSSHRVAKLPVLHYQNYCFTGVRWERRGVLGCCWCGCTMPHLEGRVNSSFLRTTIPILTRESHAQWAWLTHWSSLNLCFVRMMCGTRKFHTHRHVMLLDHAVPKHAIPVFALF